MDARLSSACQDFEAVMLRPLFAQLKLGTAQHIDIQSVDDAEPSQDGRSEDVMQSLFVDALSTALARAGGIGLARELIRSLEARRT